MRVEARRVGSARRSHLGCATALLTVALVFVAVSLLAAGIFLASPTNGNGSASFLQAQPGALHWDGKDRVTALLLGVEGQPSQVSALTVVSVDPRSQTLGLLSIPPTMWVTIPGFGSGHIADAYADGGPRLALLVTESVTKVPIPYYAVIKADTFSQIVDDLGGIIVRVPTNMNDRRFALNRREFPAVRIPAGVQRMNGATALAYMQMPQPRPQGEVGSMERQQQVMLALIQEAMQPQDFFQIPSIVNTLGGSISTNFPYDRIQTLAHVVGSVPRSHVDQAVLGTANGAVTPYGASSAVLLPDWTHIRSIAQRIVPPKGLSGGGAVEILNGAGLQGAASRLADWLSQVGLSVRGYGSAPSFRYAHTEVLVEKGAPRGALSVARTAAALLQAPLSVGTVGRGSAPVEVIIGQDFLDATQQ